MPSPTLLSPGKIKILDHYTPLERQQIKTKPAKDYLIQWFSTKISRGMPVKINSVSDKIMILQAGTGSGKSMTLGPELYKNFFEITKRNIIVTQPRILTTMNIPEDIVEIADSETGKYLKDKL